MSLKNPWVRELAWIFNSPAMIDEAIFTPPFAQIARHNINQWITALDCFPEPLIAHLSDKNLKMLGPYFEALWEFFFLNYPGFQLIAKNLQVRDGQSTIGEFDFIVYFEPTDEYFHLEVAVKYYLGIERVLAASAVSQNQANNGDNHGYNNHSYNNGYTEKQLNGLLSSPTISEKVNYSRMNQWIGPGLVDRLDKKFHKLGIKQARLSTTSAGREQLKMLGIKQISPQICLLGYLFYPHRINKKTSAREWDKNVAFTAPMLPPQSSHSQHNRGFWLKASQLKSSELTSLGRIAIEKYLMIQNFHAFSANTHLRWAVIAKPHWMAPHRKKHDELLTTDTLLQHLITHFSKSTIPQFIALFIPLKLVENHAKPIEDLLCTTPDESFVSIGFGFVVDDSWPVGN
ncbi:DUF1853 family protein [Aliikangiella maris]|uniref:DUF1853 family protein n=2 Tax=Aliikangiella maris TaxID=3162458 RepID=A0ABV3MS96_9GAMM